MPGAAIKHHFMDNQNWAAIVVGALKGILKVRASLSGLLKLKPSLSGKLKVRPSLDGDLKVDP